MLYVSVYAYVCRRECIYLPCCACLYPFIYLFLVFMLKSIFLIHAFIVCDECKYMYATTVMGSCNFIVFKCSDSKGILSCLEPWS